LDGPSLLVQEGDAGIASRIDRQRQAHTPVRIGQGNRRRAIDVLADEDSPRRRRRRRTDGPDRRVACGGIFDRVRRVQLLDQLAQARIRAVPDFQPRAPLPATL
jgi:hypothetical protein